MARELKTYAWQEHISPDVVRQLGDEKWHNQANFSVAAYSKAQAARIAGYDRPAQMFNLGTTGNELNVEVCEATPFTVFIVSQNTPVKTHGDYHEKVFRHTETPSEERRNKTRSK